MKKIIDIILSFKTAIINWILTALIIPIKKAIVISFKTAVILSITLSISIFILIIGVTKEIYENGFYLVFLKNAPILILFLVLILWALIALPFILIVKSIYKNQLSYQPTQRFIIRSLILIATVCPLGAYFGHLIAKTPLELDEIARNKEILENARMKAEMNIANIQVEGLSVQQSNPVEEKSPSISSLFESKDKGMKELKLLEKRWYDAINLAESTPRISLSGPISTLQSISRDLEATEVSECLGEAKASLSVAMANMVQANLDFMDQHEQTANTLAEEANTEFDKYKQLKDKCL